MNIIQSNSGGGCNKRTKKSSVVNISSDICSRKKDAVDGKREGDSNRNRSVNSILRPRR